MPPVSVIMVFHRDQPFLRPAIASVLQQTMRDLELVLVDNGTGLAPDALGESGRDPRVKWIRLPRNEGIPAGHNAGVAAAAGEFIALQDYDDVSLPQRIERQLAVLRGDPGLGLVSALAERIDEHDRVDGNVFCLPDPSQHFSYTQYAAAVITPVALGRRAVFERWRYRPEFPFAADLDFQARFAESGRMAVMPEVLLRYRWYGAQTTQAKAAAIEQSRAAIQLTTARRRAGRPEELSGALAAVEATSAAEAWRRGAAAALAEGFYAVAAYQARRAFALERSARSAVAAGRLGWRAWQCAPKVEKRLVASMFFSGPVRALRLRPA